MVKIIAILIILSSILSCSGPKVITHSENHLNLGLTLACIFQTDTANLGDSIGIELCYSNVSSDTIVFIPDKIILGHIDPLQFYNTDEVPAVFIGTDIDPAISRALLPKSEYCITYLVEVSDSLFNLGNNYLNVECFLKESEENGSVGRIEGSLISNEISIYIRRKVSCVTK